MPELLYPFHAANASGQFWAQQPRVSRLVCQPPNSGDRTSTGESDRLLERTNTRMIHAAPLRPNKRRKGKLAYAGEQIANMLQSARFVWAVSQIRVLIQFKERPMKTRFTILTCVMLLLGIALLARAQMERPKPAPELKKLDYFAGTWTAEGDIKPGPMGPGGKFTGTNHVQWMDGTFFLVTHSEFNGAMGKGTETAYMGYDGNDKMYTYDSFNSLGEADHAKGNVDGDTWTWQSETRMGPQTIKGRLTIKVLSATAYNFKFEMSPDGTTWNTVLEGKDTKK